MNPRRQVLSSVRPSESTHAGLWLDRYLADDGDGGRPATIRDACKASIPNGYTEAFQRRESSFAGSGTTLSFQATTTGRLVIGLGSKNVLEMGIHLDHTWGMPVLPGSALKGLASRTAHLGLGESWKRMANASSDDAGEHQAFLFGTTSRSGAVIFHDAWWKPEPKASFPLELDVMTVHHREYYQRPENPEPPTDFDSPNPVSFATTYGTFHFVLETMRPDIDVQWLEVAREILTRGLETEGLGAKTNAGYGRFAAVAKPAGPPKQTGPLDVTSLIKAVNKGNAATAVPDLLKKVNGPDRRALAIALLNALDKKWLKGRGQPWADELLEAAT